MKTEENNRMESLSCIIADLKAENMMMTERVHQLIDDYNDVARQLNDKEKHEPNTEGYTLGELTEALDKCEALEKDTQLLNLQCVQLMTECDKAKEQYEELRQKHEELQKTDEEYEALEQQYSKLLKKHTVLFYKNDALLAELPKVGDTLNQLQDNNYMLRKQLNTANANCKESEEKRVEAEEKVKEYKIDSAFVFRHYKRFEHADFVSIWYDCPHNPGVEVGDLSCVNCAHFLKADFDNTKQVLCAYDYDKEKEKQPETENDPR